MRSFFKIFFASLLALVVFCAIIFFIFIGIIAAITSKAHPHVSDKSVLVLDLSSHFQDHQVETPAVLTDEGDVPSLYNVIRLIRKAKTDNDISGIYILANGNANSAASNDELRKAIADFKTSKKFVIAYGDAMSQGSYFVASAADKIYLNPSGGIEWTGYSVMLPFLKGTLDKLGIQTQIFYAGKFKSATEIFRTDKMTDENRLQTTVWLSNLYSYFLQQASASRGVDTATLHQLANEMTIQTPQDAVQAKLVDGVKYDDEVKAEIKSKVGIGKDDKLHLVSINKYNQAVSVSKYNKDRIAVIYAEGDIVDGDGTNQNIGGDRYRALIRRARLDKNVKAIVLRVNSGGGSALASEIIWRELQMARTEDKKPVIVSFGDVAASGGYYISCGADSIFAHPNTITGSIGVFGIIPNMQTFFKDKLGITFDGVKTAPHADLTTIQPLDDKQKEFFQKGIERTYNQFKQRVADGRKKDVAYIDSIAQGRVWAGSDGLRIGLVDRIGDLDDAIACAARMAKLTDYGTREYPESGSWLQNIFNTKKSEPEEMIRQQLGEDYYKTFLQLKKIKEMTQSVQARLPYDIIIR